MLTYVCVLLFFVLVLIIILFVINPRRTRPSSRCSKLNDKLMLMNVNYDSRKMIRQCM